MAQPAAIGDRIRVHLAARCPLLYLVSFEEERVLRHVTAIAQPNFDVIYVWSITDGLRLLAGENLGEKYQGPYAALEYIAANKKRALLVLLDFHFYITEAKIIRKLRDLVTPLQSTSSAVVLLAPRLVLPPELEKDVTVFDYPLPVLADLKQLFGVIEEGIKANPRLQLHFADDEQKDVLLQAALGLTENEAKNVFAKVLVSKRSLDISSVDVLLAEKEQIVRKSGILENYATPATFASIGGLDELKSWLTMRKDALSKRARDFHLPPPKGLLLMGVPGCGKSLAAKAISFEWNQPLLKLDVGKLFGGIVGASEENVRRTIQFAEAVAPGILWIDEIEKGFAGIKSWGDSGTAARVFSTFLTWMQEKTSPVFVVATANDIAALPPELLRKGRFDEIFFVDLPFEDEREQILRVHIRKRGREPDALGIDVKRLARDTEGLSGAELEQGVVAALYKAFARNTELTTELIESAVKETYPLSETMKEPIQQMREWARYRSRYASRQWRDEQGAPKAIGRWAALDSVDQRE